MDVACVCVGRVVCMYARVCVAGGGGTFTTFPKS